MVHYSLRNGQNNLAQVESTIKYPTPVRGHEAMLTTPDRQCRIERNGTLTVYKGFVWDFGTGAIDTPDMLEPSLVHDAFCYLTDEGALPWKFRKVGDKLFYAMLRERGCGWFRAQYLYWAVRAYSKYKRFMD